MMLPLGHITSILQLFGAPGLQSATLLSISGRAIPVTALTRDERKNVKENI